METGAQSGEPAGPRGVATTEGAALPSLPPTAEREVTPSYTYFPPVRSQRNKEENFIL